MGRSLNWSFSFCVSIISSALPVNVRWAHFRTTGNERGENMMRVDVINWNLWGYWISSFFLNNKTGAMTNPNSIIVQLRWMMLNFS
jgi:hypothetical protein